jgi:hypothetical protein
MKITQDYLKKIILEELNEQLPAKSPAPAQPAQPAAGNAVDPVAHAFFLGIAIANGGDPRLVQNFLRSNRALQIKVNNIMSGNIVTLKSDSTIQNGINAYKATIKQPQAAK